jgi:glucuronoarabinoxylan endo-1,4-beta-xylanase
MRTEFPSNPLKHPTTPCINQRKASMKNIKHLLRQITGLAACVAVTSGVAAYAGTCTINLAANSQTIDGFGFSTAWCPVMSGAQADILFGTANGQIGFSLLRCRIDPNRSWANETANASAAHTRGAKVMGTAWTPPASMKNNNSLICGDLLSSQYGAYATHLSQAASTIGLDWVSMQNEPDFCPSPGYESCLPTATEIETWCANNAPAVGKPIIVPEAVNFNDSYSDPTLNNSTAASHISIVAGHFYGGGNVVHQNAINHGKHVWETEHYINGTDIGTAMTVGKEISDAMNNQFSAYFWWWIQPNDAASFIEGTTVDKRGWVMGQFARFVRPSKVRCSSTYNPSSNVFVTAYHNGGVVVVALNTGTSSVSQTFTFQNASGISTLLVNRTSSSENIASASAASVVNNTFTYTLPAQSITTFHQF